MSQAGNSVKMTLIVQALRTVENVMGIRESARVVSAIKKIDWITLISSYILLH